MHTLKMSWRTCLWMAVSAVLMVSRIWAAVVFESDFSGAAGPLAGREGYFSRTQAICLDGRGLAGLGQGTDAYVKSLVALPDDVERIRLNARVNVSPLPDSDMRNHHAKGENPAWIALGVSDNASPQNGMAASKLSISVASNGREVSVGLGRSVGAEPPAFGTHVAPGQGVCEVALEYNFTTQTATAFLDGKEVLKGVLSLSRRDFASVGFQLRRMRPLTDTQPGGVKAIKMEVLAVRPAVKEPPAIPEKAPPRINAEHERAQRLEKQLDAASTAEAIITALRAGWDDPPATYRTHTRWWWPGNAVTREGLDGQLEQMKAQGFGGVEIMSFLKIFEKGNIEFDTPEFFAMVKHVVDKARALGMEVSLSLGPGWNHGNASVPEADRNKVLVFAEQDVVGGVALDVAIATPKTPAYAAMNKKKLEAVVAVALDASGKPDPARRIDLTASAKGARAFSHHPSHTVNPSLPPGPWRILSAWTVFTGSKCAAEDYEPRSWVVDHLSRKAMRDYVTRMGDRYRAAFGADFGQTVDSFFGDSYELAQDFSLWSDGLFERFEREKGYDLRPYLPMLLYAGAPETPYVRYDFGHFLHTLGMEAAMRELAAYCERTGIHMRQQPHYRFTTELIEASGVLQRPETEFTRRSFEPKAYPHKLTTSGAWLYPSREKRWVSCEAFTFINERYRTTMEEIKRATDLFLRDGITQFYNHGYFYTPEKEVEPARDLIWMNRISHVNTWWPYYRGLADYQARAAFLSRQGRADADVLLYAPMPTLWAERAQYPCSHQRDLPFEHLAKILVANGYDFDCVNDDLLRRHARIKDGRLFINGYDYSTLILPRAMCLAPDTLGVLEAFVKNGGTVIALDTLPKWSPGLMRREKQDAALHTLRDRLFATQGGAKQVGRGFTYFMPECGGFEYLKTWSPGAKEWAPTEPLTPAYADFIQTLRRHATPDFEIAGLPQSDGLTFRHTRIGDVDCWFICNLQPTPSRTEVTLNTKGKTPQLWDAMCGSAGVPTAFRFAADGRVVIPVDLDPWASIFVLLTPGGVAADQALPARPVETRVVSVPGPWRTSFEGLGGWATNMTMHTLVDWARTKGLEDFSGRAVYVTDLVVNARPSGKTVLDLGSVREVASVRINGQPAGVVWMQPYRMDISRFLRDGENEIEITVVNLLWNFVMGLKAPRPIPEELRAQYGASWKQNYNGWNGLQTAKKRSNNERLPSGLLGPVAIRFYQENTK